MTYFGLSLTDWLVLMAYLVLLCYFKEKTLEWRTHGAGCHVCGAIRRHREKRGICATRT